MTFFLIEVHSETLHYGSFFNRDESCADFAFHFGGREYANAIMTLDISRDFSAHDDFRSLDVRRNAAIRSNGQLAFLEANSAAYFAIDYEIVLSGNLAFNDKRSS